MQKRGALLDGAEVRVMRRRRPPAAAWAGPPGVRRGSRIAAAFLIVACAAFGGRVRATEPASSSGTAALPWLHVEGNRIKDERGKTVVLRGISLIDLGLLTARKREGGVNGAIDRNTGPGWHPRVIRLPVYPPHVPDGGGYSSPNPFPFTPDGNDAYYREILRPAVDYATSKGLYVIIDYHQIATSTSFAAGITETEDKRCQDFWTFMAPKFANQSNVLYEVYNEPIDDVGTPTQSWNAYAPRAQRWVDIIRAAAPRNLILVGSPHYDQFMGAVATRPLRGANLVYTAHPYPFSWGTSFQAQLAAAMTKVPLILTEWGFTGLDTSFANKLRNVAEPNAISWIAWCNDWAWSPPMYTNNTYATLNAYGEFVKRWLLDKKDSDQPAPRAALRASTASTQSP